MGSSDWLYRALQEIAGRDFVSGEPEEKYIYGRIPSGVRTGDFDYLVLPGTVQQVQKIVRLAAREGVPIVPVGGGLSLSVLTVPLKGGIVMDMKRMDAILRVNEQSRFAVVEAGVSIGKLVGYFQQHHPRLRISVADAPPSATICGNCLIYGSGHLSKYGAHSEMINGLEVVLHSGEVCRLGYCADGPGPCLPDLTGLFANWFGGTGIVTKLSLKLYPRHRFREVLIFKIENPDTIPEAIQRVTATGILEDVLIFAMKQKESSLPMTLLQLFITADTPREMALKRELLTDLYAHCQNRGSSILPVPNSLFPDKFIDDLLAEPKLGIEGSVDNRKGGGSAYVGASLPLEKIPAAYRGGLEISRKYGFTGPLYTIRNIGLGHSVIFTFMYPYSRDDPESFARMQKASREAVQLIQGIDGVVWKAAAEKQKEILAAMDPGNRELIRRVKQEMDPRGIFNPGNWDHDVPRESGKSFLN